VPSTKTWERSGANPVTFRGDSNHHVSRGHLSRYCDEFAFRYENRKTTDGQRADLLVKGAEGKRLTYKQPAGISA
jgi:hypothetical protein